MSRGLGRWQKRLLVAVATYRHGFTVGDVCPSPDPGRVAYQAAYRAARRLADLGWLYLERTPDGALLLGPLLDNWPIEAARWIRTLLRDPRNVPPRWPAPRVPKPKRPRRRRSVVPEDFIPPI